MRYLSTVNTWIARLFPCCSNFGSVVVCLISQNLYWYHSIVFVVCSLARLFINLHKSPVLRVPAAQTADGYSTVRAPVFPSSATFCYRVATPRAEVLVAERGFTQALPVVYAAFGLLGVWASVVGSCGLWFCCMALSASEVYRLTVDQSRQKCLERGLKSSGPV